MVVQLGLKVWAT